MRGFDHVFVGLLAELNTLSVYKRAIAFLPGDKKPWASLRCNVVRLPTMRVCEGKNACQGMEIDTDLRRKGGRALNLHA